MLTIFNGVKMIACCDHKGQWWWIEGDCTCCGECCDDRGPEWRYAKDDICGGCQHLLEPSESGERLCNLRTDRPFSCCINDPHSNPDYCKVRFKKVSKWALIILIRSVVVV